MWVTRWGLWGDADRNEAFRCFWQPLHREPCCLSPRPVRANPEFDKSLEGIKTAEDEAKLPFFARAQLATAAAWSPDPKNPPLYCDLPVKNGEVQEDVVAKWTANAPLAFIDQYIDNLRQYRAIAIDVGDQEGLRFDTAKLHEVLNKYGISNSFEIITARIPARWRTVSRTMRCRSSAKTSVFNLTASSRANQGGQANP